jgi:hypothetical protein
MPSPFSEGTGPDAHGDVAAEITSLLGEHDRAWGRLDIESLAELWDTDAPFPVYLGEEYSHPITTWPDLARHWARLGARLRAATVKSELTTMNLLGLDLAATVALVDWRFVGVESSTEHHGLSWATAIMRHRAVGWRFLHYMEAPIFFADEQPEQPG